MGMVAFRLVIAKHTNDKPTIERTNERNQQIYPPHHPGFAWAYRGELRGHADVLGGGIASLGAAVAAREHNQLGLVGLEALDVLLQRLGRLVAATVVDGNANRARPATVNTSLIQVCKRVRGG